MLTKKDVELLAEVFATKADLEKLASKEDVVFIRSDLNSAREQQQNFETKTESLFNEIKKDIETTTETLQEFIVTTEKKIMSESATMRERLDEHEKWDKQLAEKIGIVLK